MSAAGSLQEERRDAAQGRPVDPRMLRRLLSYVRPQARWIALGLGCLLAASACRLALPWLVKTGIDRHFMPRQWQGFGWLAAGFVAVAVLEMIFRRVQTVAVETAGQNALYGLRLQVFRRLQRLPAGWFDRHPTGRLVGRTTTDVEALQELFSSGVVTILGDFVFMATILVILFALNWQLTLVVLLVVPLMLAMTMFVRQRVRAAYVEMRARLSQMNAFLHERVEGMPVMQMFRREASTRDAYAEINGGVRDAQLRTVRWESVLSAGTEMVGSFTYALILWYGGSLLVERDPAAGGAPGALAQGLTLGTLFAFIDYMHRFFHPLNELSLKYTVLQNATTACRRIFEVLDDPARTPEPARPAPPPAPRGEIVFEDVSFSYATGDGEAALHGVGFRVAPGEKVALVGATGAGKTTVLKLLTRLYDPQEGRILLDGRDVRDYALEDLRTRVGMVSQDVFLFEGDVLENVRLGKPGISREDARAAADRLHLDQVVRRFPRGYEETVRERGKNLSSGEKQLVSFARALAAAPEVLALDEATSNVDSHTEHLLQEAVRELMEGRTSLVVAHRLSTVRDADRILVFHHGRLVEEGDHDALMRERGRYWRLVQLQYGAEARAT